MRGGRRRATRQADATQAAIISILEDPNAYGTREEVLDRLEDLAAPGTEMDDVVFGPAAWRAAWDNTLFGGLDATIHTWKRWLSEDGSQGGSLWTWSGTARNGEPFELPGISLETYDREGLETSAIVYYPLESADVRRIFREGG